MLDDKTKPLTFAAYKRDEQDEPFTGDGFGRRELAAKLNQFLPRLRDGAVIAIDAPWGAGKTWFGQNWAASLKAAGHEVAYINAFEQDYTEDPFLPIAAEFSGLLESGATRTLREKAAAVGGALLPVGAKALLGLASKWALNGLDIPKEFAKAVETAEESSEEFVKHWVMHKLETHEQEKESLNGFRLSLANAAKQKDKPVIVFVDELDRCRPDFAVRLIERIKHFFETPNVIFILLINRTQFHNAIQGVYGAGTDAAAYLTKFIHFFFALPAVNTRNYISTMMGRYGLSHQILENSNFGDSLEYWKIVFDLTLRDIERACALFAYAQRKDAPGFLAYLIALKMKRPDLYSRLLNDDWKAHQETSEWVNDMQARHGLNELVKSRREYYSVFSQLHLIHINYRHETEALNLVPLGQGALHVTRDKLYDVFLREIDLPIF
jgi:hypothetical protein